MKEILTKEQSQRLLDLGVPKEKASKLYWKEVTDYRGRPFEFDYDFREGTTDKPFALQRVGLTTFEKQDIFTLTDLLEILPKTLKEGSETCFHLRMEYRIDRWVVGYYNFGIPYFYDKVFHREELIDALYDLAVYCLEWKEINFAHE